MKTTKRTIPCHVCGASTTTAWHSCVDIDGKTYCYPVTNCPNCHASARGKIALYSRICRKNRVRQLKHTIARLKARERKRAVLDLTEWQRVYLAECIIQSEIDDQETWLEYAEGEDMKDAIKLRLDALRKLKAFLDGCGKQEGGQA